MPAAPSEIGLNQVPDALLQVLSLLVMSFRFIEYLCFNPSFGEVFTILIEMIKDTTNVIAIMLLIGVAVGTKLGSPILVRTPGP